MKHRIDHLKDHYIIAGFGRVGQQVARELANEGQPFVILEQDEAKLALAKDKNWAYLVGDVAVDEKVLEQARIKEAHGVIIAVGTDADAIFMAISARAIKPDIFIVARASSREAADKLQKIGVNRIALPYQIGGYHMATMALRPSVVDFLDLLVDQERDELEMEEYSIYPESHFIGQTLDEAGFVQEGIAVLAIRRKDGKAVINPGADTKLHAADRLVVMGSEKQLEQVTKSFRKHQPEKEEVEQKLSATEPKVSPVLPSE